MNTFFNIKNVHGDEVRFNVSNLSSYYAYGADTQAIVGTETYYLAINVKELDQALAEVYCMIKKVGQDPKEDFTIQNSYYSEGEPCNDNVPEQTIVLPGPDIELEFPSDN